MPGIRSGPEDDTPFNRACTTIMRLIDRVYAGNLGKSEGCRQLILAFRRTIDRDEYDAANYNPYQALADRLKRDFPEVWRGDGDQYSARQALSPWGVS